jgi:hypothetical protein
MTRGHTHRRIVAALCIAGIAAWSSAARAETVSELYAAGVTSFQAGRYEEAAQAFRDLAGKYRVLSPDVQVGLGAAEFETGRPGNAIAAFHRAIRLAPESPAADTARVDLARVRTVLSQQAGRPTAGTAFVFGAYADAWTTLTGWASPGAALAVFLLSWTLFFGALGTWRLLESGRLRITLGTAAVVLGITTALAGSVAWGSARVAAYRIGVVVHEDAGLLDDVAATEATLSLPAGLEVRVLESRGGWHHVRLSSGREGWLSDRVLDVP